MSNTPLRLRARKLLNFPTEVLKKRLKGPLTLVFDDGQELQTDARDTIFSSFIWDFHREYHKAELKITHHITHLFPDKYRARNTMGKLMAQVMWDVYDTYSEDPESEWSAYDRRADFRGHLCHLLYRIFNDIYNHLSVDTIKYAKTLSIEDFIEAMDNPVIKNLIDSIRPDGRNLEHVYKGATDALLHEPSLEKNSLSFMIRSGLTDKNQTNQCIIARGVMTDVGSDMFPIPIVTNLTKGISLFHDSLIESRSMSKSLYFTTTPLQFTEYFSRRQQLVSMVLRDMDEKDCGSKTYTNIVLKEKDLTRYEGKYYLEESTGRIKVIAPTSRELVGKSIPIRMVKDCLTKNPYGVCIKCIGQLGLSIFSKTNIGGTASVSLISELSQKVLSVKHLDGSSVVDPIELDEYQQKFIIATQGDDGYLLSPDINDCKVELILDKDWVPGIVDIRDVKNPDDLIPTRVSEMDSITLRVTYPNGKGEYADIAVGMIRRKASLTMNLLKYIREHSWKTETFGEFENYVFDLTNWDRDEPFLSIPKRHFNMSDLADEIARLIESTKDEMDDRDKNVDINDFIEELYSTVNSRLSVNIAVIELVVQSILIVSATDKDFSLPKPWSKGRGIGVAEVTFSHRSLSAKMAYERQRDSIMDPVSYTLKNRIDHPFDVILNPNEVLRSIPGTAVYEPRG